MQIIFFVIQRFVKPSTVFNSFENILELNWNTKNLCITKTKLKEFTRNNFYQEINFPVIWNMSKCTYLTRFIISHSWQCLRNLNYTELHWINDVDNQVYVNFDFSFPHLLLLVRWQCFCGADIFMDNIS